MCCVHSTCCAVCADDEAGTSDSESDSSSSSQSSAKTTPGDDASPNDVKQPSRGDGESREEGEDDVVDQLISTDSCDAFLSSLASDAGNPRGETPANENSHEDSPVISTSRKDAVANCADDDDDDALCDIPVKSRSTTRRETSDGSHDDARERNGAARREAESRTTTANHENEPRDKGNDQSLSEGASENTKTPANEIQNKQDHSPAPGNALLTEAHQTGDGRFDSKTAKPQTQETSAFPPGTSVLVSLVCCCEQLRLGGSAHTNLFGFFND